jgi:long-chain acyl-CoA synthetase
MAGRRRAPNSITSAAPCAPEVIEYWQRLGVPLHELYGMSETTAAVTANRQGASRTGTVGRPLSGVEVKLSDDGEILVRGPIVMRGYRNLPQATARSARAPTSSQEPTT